MRTPAAWSIRLKLLNATARCLLAIAAVSLACLSTGAVAQDMPPVDSRRLASRGNEIQMFVENDFWSGTDRYYTNGIKIGIGAPLEFLQDFLTAPPQWALRHLSRIDGDVHLGFFAGQNIYTPRSIRVAASQPFDRPWAAWLYVGGVAQRVREDSLDTVELDVGMVGPAALGRQVQTGWHRLVGVQRPLGWDNQLPNEAAFLISYLHKRRWGGENIELIPHAGITAGTVLTLARAGGMLRVGRNMSGFGTDSIEPGGAMLKNTRRETENGGRDKLEWYGFVGADYRLVARNIFLDGTVFHDSPSVQRRRAVHDLSAGLSFRYRWLRFSLTHILRSEEFTTAGGGGGKQSFDSLNLGLEF